MITTTLSQAKKQVGQVLPFIKGTLIEIWDYKQGKKPGSNRGYSFQNGILLDEQGERMKVTFAFRPPVPSEYKGKELAITSKMGTSGGLQGILVKENEYNGNVDIILEVNKAAHVELDDGDDIQYDTPPEVPERRQDAPQRPPEAKAGHPDLEPHRRLEQMARLYVLCRLAVVGSLPAGNEDTLRAATACLYIQASKEGLDRKLPTLATPNRQEEEDPNGPEQPF